MAKRNGGASRRDNSGVPNRPKTPLLAVRVPMELRQEAMRIARERGETISDIVRDCLRAYVKRYGG